MYDFYVQMLKSKRKLPLSKVGQYIQTPPCNIYLYPEKNIYIAPRGAVNTPRSRRHDNMSIVSHEKDMEIKDNKTFHINLETFYFIKECIGNARLKFI